MSILVAEDDDATRITMSYILERAGFKVEQVRNGIEAVSQAKSGKFQVILMDIEMPMMDGPRAIALLKRDPVTKRIPVVVLSQNASGESVKSCLKAGAVDFVVKQNLKPDQLVQKLVKHATTTPKEVVASASAGEPRASAAGAGGGSVAAPAAAPPAAGQEQSIDQDAWKQKAAALGRSDREKTRAAIAEMPGLPAIFPDGASEIYSAVHGGNLSPDKLHRLIEQDIGALVGVLDTANKNQANTNERASEVEVAARWLGNMGINDAIKKLQDKGAAVPPDRASWVWSWWRHSAAVSAIAGELALAVEISPGTVRVAGMMHDIGKLLLLCSSVGDKVAACYDQGKDMVFPTVMAEQMLLGLNHKQIGQDYLNKLSLPSGLANVCASHDLDDAGLAKLGENDAQIGAVICAANQIAKAAGLGVIPNEELMPLPSSIAGATMELELQINSAIDEINKLSLVRTNQKEWPKPAIEQVSLSGLMVVFISPLASPWNPYQKMLVRAGAKVTAFNDVKVVIDKAPAHDLMVVDQMTGTLSTALPLLRRLCQVPSISMTPKLLLARRADDPEMLVSQSNLPVTVYSSPIRCGSLLRMVKGLASN